MNWETLCRKWDFCLYSCVEVSSQSSLVAEIRRWGLLGKGPNQWMIHGFVLYWLKHSCQIILIFKRRQSSFSGKHFVGIAGIKIWLPWFLFHQASLDFVMIWVLWLHPSCFLNNNSITITLLSLSNKNDLFRNFLSKTFCIWVDFGSLKAVRSND